MSAEKNWLLRTKSNHILGPISKDKAIELYKNGSIKPDDEICSGNGFWFFIREDDMVSRFLTGKEVQNFNPISEAKDVLTSHLQGQPAQDDITLVGSINTSMLKKNEAPAPRAMEASSPSIVLPKTQEQKKKSDPVKAKAPVKKLAKKQKSQSYLLLLSLLGFATLFMLLYFRKTIIKEIFQGEVTLNLSSFISEAHAQEVLPEKKKSF
ncbi:MAG TPA: hypothetical protein VNJ01_06320 [Bacteriovoracaceae bacterium]|nr:hypothetical protein [Bacteriovoracaceae bacterium]